MNKNFLDRNLALEAVRVTEASALSSSLYMGRGNEKAADQAAVNAMRTTLMNSPINSKIAIGEGEIDEAPMLYIGEKLGTCVDDDYSPALDIAVDPLECTKNCANNLPNSMTVMAIGPQGKLFSNLQKPNLFEQIEKCGRIKICCEKLCHIVIKKGGHFLHSLLLCSLHQILCLFD